MTQRLSIKHLQVLAAFRRTGSLSKIAEFLKLTPSAVSRRIDEAEARLGLALFAKASNRVRLTPAGESDRAFKGFESVFVPFHWHGDRFELPPGSQSLMTSEACAHQAFSAGAGVVGIQFHLEVTAANLHDWFAGKQPAPETYVQTAEEVLHDLPRFARSNALMHQLLANMEAA